MRVDNILTNFCQNIRHLRKVHNLTQKEMASILGISAGKLSKIEREELSTRIDCRMLCRVCDYFHISSDKILYENWPEMLRKKL